MNETSEQQRKPACVSPAEALRILLIALFFGGAAFFLYGTSFGRLLKQNHGAALGSWIQDWGRGSWVVFILAGTLLISAGFPRLLFAFIAGAIFNTLIAVLLAQLAACLAAILGYYSVRLLGRDVIARRFQNPVRHLDKLLDDHGFMVFLFLRVCPVGHTLLTNSLAGLSSVSFRIFFAASFVGFLPMTFVCVLLGSGFSDPFHLKFWIGIGSFVIISLLSLWHFKRSRLGRGIAEMMRSKG